MLALFLDTFLATLFIIICVLLIFVVLLQKGRGGGLSAAFSGMGSTAFGTRVGDVLTWVTIVMTALFLLLATAVTLQFKPEGQPAPAPTFMPGGMPIADKISVVIESQRGAKVWYTLDGSAPEKDAKGSTLYGAAVVVEPGQTLKARAYVEGFLPSEITSADYRLEAKGPELEPATMPATAPAVTTRPASMIPATMPASMPAN